MSDFADLFEIIGADFDAEQQARQRTAALVEADRAVGEFLLAATTEAEFGHRVAVARPRLEVVQRNHGVEVDLLVSEYARKHALKREALARTAAEKRPFEPTHMLKGQPVQQTGWQAYNDENQKQYVTEGGGMWESRWAHQDDFEPISDQYGRPPEHPHADAPTQDPGAGSWAGQTSFETTGHGPTGNVTDQTGFKERTAANQSFVDTLKTQTDASLEHLYRTRGTVSPEHKDAIAAEMESRGKSLDSSTRGDNFGKTSARTDDWERFYRQPTFNERMASIRHALSEGVDPLTLNVWDQGIGGGEPSYHTDTQAFAGQPGSAQEKVEAQAGASQTGTHHDDAPQVRQAANQFGDANPF